jgi:hypothetical protein
MTDDRHIRACDQDRETAVEVLRDAYAAGRLRPEEFGQRTDAAYAAVTWGDLDDLTADLPPAWAGDRALAPPPRHAARCPFGPAAWVLVFFAIAVLAGQVPWLAVVALPAFLLLLPLAARRGSAGRRDAGPRPPLPGARLTDWQHRSIS